jgi:cell wall-associated NlpC family hydrolase
MRRDGIDAGGPRSVWSFAKEARVRGATEPSSLPQTTEPMRRPQARTRTTIARLALVAAFVVPGVVLQATGPSIAAPTASDVAKARSRAQTLNQEFGLAVERYNQAAGRLAQTQQQLAAAKAAMDAAQAKASAARAQLTSRAVSAYTDMGSQLDALLGSGSLTQLTDRLEYLGALSQSDADLAAQADAAAQEAAWAAQRYATIQQQERDTLAQLASQRAHIQQLAQQAQAYYENTNQRRQDYLKALAAQRAQARAQARAEAQQQQQQQQAPTPTIPTTTPLPPSAGAAAAIAAAKSVLGVQYVFAAADPSIGFDCSGLTMWAWAHAGVSLPHSAAEQYAVLPHVALSDLQPGDLIFFYSPISHVAMYLGGGLIIHATHPGPGGEVHIESLSPIWTPLIVGAARP